MKKNSIKYWWVLAGILLFTLIALILGPLFPAPVVPIIGLIFLIIARKKEWMKDYTSQDTGMILLSTIIFIVALIGMNVFALSTVPWWEIILLGLLADAIAFGCGFVPVVGDIVSGIVIFFLIFQIVGGFTGIILGGLGATLALIPGPSLFFVTIAFIVLKLISAFLGDLIRSII